MLSILPYIILSQFTFLSGFCLSDQYATKFSETMGIKLNVLKAHHVIFLSFLESFRCSHLLSLPLLHTLNFGASLIVSMLVSVCLALWKSNKNQNTPKTRRFDSTVKAYLGRKIMKVSVHVRIAFSKFCTRHNTIWQEIFDGFLFSRFRSLYVGFYNLLCTT